MADLLEVEFPRCQCEQYSVGNGSPGPISDIEAVQRIIISPRDYDAKNCRISEAPFRKVAENGLSVCRNIASNDHIEALAIDGLARRDREEGIKQIWAICEASVDELRSMLDDDGERLFCIYDQTVSRRTEGDIPVPTHAGIFLRRPSKGTAERTRLQKDYAGRLREKFLEGVLDLEKERNGLFAILNGRARAGEF